MMMRSQLKMQPKVKIYCCRISSSSFVRSFEHCYGNSLAERRSAAIERSRVYG